MLISQRIVTFFCILILTLSSLLAAESASACTRILIAAPEQPVLVGRTMDWYQDMQTNLVVYPRGIQRDGMATDSSLQWKSKYGSIVATVFDIAATDGMNEQGLAAHMLWLDETDFGVRDKSKKAISVVMWVQYMLDNFATVDEAVKFTQLSSVQIEALNIPLTDEGINVHLALEDASGDSAIVEYVKGNVQVYHNSKYNVLTNSPTLDLQMDNLKHYGGFGGEKSLPGTTDSMDRFVRATYYAEHLPKAGADNEVMTSLLSIIQNVSEPYGVVSNERPVIEPTLWRTVSDLTNKLYYFNSSDSLGFIWADTKKFNFNSGAPVLKLDLVKRPNLIGDVTSEFTAIPNK